MKDARTQAEPRTMLDAAIPVIAAQITSITVISPVVGMALNAAFWSTILGIGFATAIISEARVRLPRLIAAHAQEMTPAAENRQHLSAYAI